MNAYNTPNQTTQLLKQIGHELRSPAVIIAVSMTLIATLFGWLLIENSFTVMKGDAVAYWAMAQVPIDPNQSWTWDGVANSNVPYTYRILIPFIVRNFFHSSMNGFIFIAISSLLICNYIIFKISKLFTNDNFIGFFMVMVFSTNFTIVNPLVNSALVDLPSFVCILLIAYLFFRYLTNGSNQSVPVAVWIFLSVILVVAALIKEWIFFVLPVLFLFFLSDRKPRKAFLLFCCALPAVITHVVVRLVMGFFTDIQIVSFTLLYERYITSFWAYRSLFATYGAIWMFIPLTLWFSFKNHRSKPVTYLPFILSLLVAIVMCTIASDHNRYLFFISFPFLIPALSLYFTRYNTPISKSTLSVLALLLLFSRLAINYRPMVPEGLALIADRTESTLIVIIVASAIQIFTGLYYIWAIYAQRHSQEL
jgi:hypothetical protein